MWIDNTGQWNLAKLVPKDECDNYGRCGPYGICDPAGLPESECTCLPGFEPRSDRDWHVGDWSRGCVRRRPLDCGKGDGFLRLARVKLPDTSRSRVEAGLSLKACEDECLKDCSCTAYASANISGEGKGCVMWGGDLIDLKVYSDGGQDFYTRVDASELGMSSYHLSMFNMKFLKLGSPCSKSRIFTWMELNFCLNFDTLIDTFCAEMTHSPKRAPSLPLSKENYKGMT